MPVQTSYPGVYVQEVPSGGRTITGVSTSVTAFVGYLKRGPVDEPVRLFNFGDFDRIFGGLDAESEVAYAVRHFFLNGGTEAHVVRTARGEEVAAIDLLKPDLNTTVMTVAAANAGRWGNDLRVEIDHGTPQPEDRFNLTVGEYRNGDEQPEREEVFRNLSLREADERYAGTVVSDGSQLIDVTVPGPIRQEAAQAHRAGQTLPQPQAFDDYRVGDTGGTEPFEQVGEGKDGDPPGAAELKGDRDDKKGIWSLLDVDLVNILSVPRTAELDEGPAMDVIGTGLEFCEEERGFMIVDVPDEAKFRGPGSVDAVKKWVSDNASTLRHDHAALYFPRVEIADPLDEYRPRSVGASGAMAGVYARTDTERGVWKAPAGTEATLRGVESLEYKLTDMENGVLNPLGINCLRNFPVYGSVSWGGRTLRGADQLADEYKYVPVRRTALFIEESLYRGLQWVVFEPNDPTLWGEIRKSVGSFMQNLFQEGAFQGTSASEAYFVKCDSETTTQYDIDNGIVNIVVGFAPLKPAEFVILKIKQIAGQNQ